MWERGGAYTGAMKNVQEDAAAPDAQQGQAKVALVTGATNGIGKVTARELARLGMTVVIVGRDPDKTRATVEELRRDSGNSRLEGLVADLGVQAQVRRLARDFRARHGRLDVLVNNAGALNGRRQETPDGIEVTWAVNHLAYFLLTTELQDLLTRTPGARVVNVSSEAHRAGPLRWEDLEGKLRYSGWQSYSQSKLANVLFSRELARRLRTSGVRVNAVHPGFVASGFGKNTPGWLSRVFTWAAPLARSEEEGARTSIFVATSPTVAGLSGRYFSNEREVQPAPFALDDAAAARLWRLSEEMTREG